MKNGVPVVPKGVLSVEYK